MDKAIDLFGLLDPKLVRLDPNKIRNQRRIIKRRALIFGRLSILATLLILLFIGPGYQSFLNKSDHTSKQKNKHSDDQISLIVLPFQNIGESVDEDYFTDGMAQEISTVLGRAAPGKLVVIGRSSSMV